jgi:transcriptional regulator with XRE-family HTH domain
MTSGDKLTPIEYNIGMDAAKTLREARKRAGLTQAELARRARTSQATISAYERGRKDPSVATLSRLLAAMGLRLEVVQGPPKAIMPSRRELARRGRQLISAIEHMEIVPHSFDDELLVPPVASIVRSRPK